MKLVSNPDLSLDLNQAIENVGDELAMLARDACTAEQERISLLRGLRQGLTASGFSETDTQNIAATLTHRIMTGRPDSPLSDEIAWAMERGAMLEALHEKLGQEDSRFKRIEVTVLRSCLFVDASLMIFRSEHHLAALNTELPKAGACLFFAGAVYYLARHYNLDESDSQTAACRVLKYFGLSEKNAKLIIDGIPLASQEPVGREALAEGRNAISNWLSDKDKNAILRLFTLVKK